MVRIDRLEEAPNRILQIASVIGREFTSRLLERLANLGERVETHFHELTALELTYEKYHLLVRPNCPLNKYPSLDGFVEAAPIIPSCVQSIVSDH